MQAIWRHELGPTDKLVALRIADLVRDDLTFFGSLAGVAEATGLNAGTVRRSVRRLQDEGLLSLVKSEQGKPSVYKLCITVETPRAVRAPRDHEPRALCAEPRALKHTTPRAARAKPLITLKEPIINNDQTSPVAESLAAVFAFHRPTAPALKPDTQAIDTIVQLAATAPHPEQAIQDIPLVLAWALQDPFWSKSVVHLAAFAKCYQRIAAAKPTTHQQQTAVPAPDCPQCENRRVVLHETTTGVTAAQCGCVNEMSYT